MDLTHSEWRAVHSALRMTESACSHARAEGDRGASDPEPFARLAAQVWEHGVLATLPPAPRTEVERLVAENNSLSHFADVAERVERRNNALVAELEALRAAIRNSDLRAVSSDETHGL